MNLERKMEVLRLIMLAANELTGPVPPSLGIVELTKHYGARLNVVSSEIYEVLDMKVSDVIDQEGGLEVLLQGDFQ